MVTQTSVELQTLAHVEPSAPLQLPYHESSPAASLPGDVMPSTALLSRRRAIMVILQICGMTFFAAICDGIIVVALPAIQVTLQLDEGLLVWPNSSYYLAAGTCLLLAGTVADTVGNKTVYLAGASLATVFALACGIARTGGEMIAFRAFQGITFAMITPASISIISSNVEEGRPRNLGFACMGFAHPLGFSFGLVMGGVFTDTVGWRGAFYLASAATGALFLLSIWGLPADLRPEAGAVSVWRRLVSGIDFVGVALASSALAMFSYFLAAISSDINNIRKPASIVTLVIACLLVPSFVGWMHYQVKGNRTALIPNALWRSHVFTSVCLMVLLSNALTSCMELYSSLFFQRVQGTSALVASLQVAPSLIAGALTSIATGIFVHRMSPLWMLVISSVVSTVAPLLMAVTRVDQLYWENAFFAQILAPISCDLLFTVGLLIISDVFPRRTQALGGAVFNTCAQLGNAIGLSVTQVVATSVTRASSSEQQSSADALMQGYRVAFWTMFGWMLFVCVVCVAGMRRVGVIGIKRD